MANNPNIQSRINGLVITVPPQARGMLGRFATRGENELVFVKPKGVKPADAKGGANSSKAVIESTTLDQSTKPSDLA
jgi:hypothetical protein